MDTAFIDGLMVKFIKVIGKQMSLTAMATIHGTIIAGILDNGKKT